MIRLGWRLATSAGPASFIGITLTALAVALGTAILLFALSFSPALDARYLRSAWREPELAGASPATMLFRPIHDRFRDEVLLRIQVAPLSPEAPVVPGTDRVPSPGEAFVSPALAERLLTVPPDELAGRIGRVIGTIGGESLRSPQELVAIIGVDPSLLREAGATEIVGFDKPPRVPDLPPILVLMVVLAAAGAMAPVAVFVGTATRLSAARREQRLAALRLVGATPRQVRQLAVVEALIPTLVGTAAGVVLFFLARRLIALVPLDEATWWPETIAPPIVPALALVALVPVVGALAAVVSLRRVVVTPLGVQRRQTPPRPTPVRLVPLVVSIVVLVATLVFFRNRATESITGILVLGGSFAGIIGGMALAGPWLTSLVGRALFRLPRGGASTLLASRRLTDDPRGSFGSIAGVVMAVFVASAFFTFAGFARGQAGITQTAGSAGILMAGLPQSGGPDAAPMVEQLRAGTGIRAVLPVADGLLVDGAGQANWSVWVVACRDLAAVPASPFSGCGRSPVHVVAGSAVAAGRYRLVASRSFGNEPVSTDLTIRARDLGTVERRDIGTATSFGYADVLLEPSAFGGIGAELPVSFVTIWTDGSTAATDRVRTVVGNAYPSVYVSTFDRTSASAPIFEEFGRVVQLGLFGSLLLAGCSLAVAVTTGIVERRREFALLRSAGMPVSRLRSVVMLQAGVPLIAVAVFSALLGIVVAQVVLSLASSLQVPLPDASLVLTLTGSVAAALGVVALTLPPLERLTRPDSIRME